MGRRARNGMRTPRIRGQHRIGVCKGCGELLGTYGGCNGPAGDHARHVRDNRIFALAHDSDLAHSAHPRCKDDLTKERFSPSDFASMVPFAVPILGILLQNNDPVMSGPFEEPDEFFLRRQAATIGECLVEVVSDYL